MRTILRKTAGGLVAGQLALTPGLSIDYQAPPECPNAASFEAQVVSRLADEKPLERREPVRVRIGREAEGFHGSVELGEPPTARELDSADCGELLQALALIAAVLLQSESESQSKPPRVETPAIAPAAALPSPARAQDTRATSPRWVAVLGLGGGIEQGSLPSPWLAPRIRLGMEFGRVLPWAAEIGVSATLPRSAEVSVEDTRATLRLSAARLDGCVTRRFDPRWQLAGCALFEAGRLDGRSAMSSGAQHMLWLAPGIQLRAELVLGRPWSVFAQASDRWPLVRGRFAFSRPTTPPTVALAYEVPAQALAAEIGVFVRFE